MPFVDALPAPPRRIVSLVPSQTELLAALGLDAEVVGLTRFCVHPAGWKARKTIVGGTKETEPARVLALDPDLVIANREENDREPIEALAAAVPVHVTDVATVGGALAMIREVGALVGRGPEAEALAAEIGRRFDALPTFAPLRALYLIWRDPWMTVGDDTFISDVMARAGLINVVGDRARYPTLAAGEIAALAPDVVLLSSEPFPFAETHMAEVEALAPDAQVALVDGEAFSWYGSRLLDTPAALLTLRQRLA
ncbi:helical backbone metal receptor [Rubrivirga sp. IMCC43871]|uniref:helical backbone metal receptor n=1 Tax=Rubrivirga sp. IMCC43871 TaxID=3391575 RepID=UPI00399035C0